MGIQEVSKAVRGDAPSAEGRMNRMEPIYIGPTGWKVFEFSHSQYSKYKQCPKRFEIERIKGWKQKPGASLEFGKAIEFSVKSFYTEKREPREAFESSWNLNNPALIEKILADANVPQEEIAKRISMAERLGYPDKESWDSMRDAGLGLMGTFARDFEKYPPRKPFFPEFKRPFNVQDKATGNPYQTIPDLIDEDGRGKFIADLKSLGNLLDDSCPGLVANDIQLRTQAAATGIFRVALWNFCRKPKRGDPLTAERICEEVRKLDGSSSFVPRVAIYVAREVNSLTIDAAGDFLGISNAQELAKELRQIYKTDAALKASADEIVATLSKLNGPKYVIQWVEAEIPKEHAFEAIREEMSVVPLIQQGWFPRRGGVRFPDNDCVWCPARGLCMEEIFGKKPEYDAITQDEMEPWDRSMMEGID